MPELAASVGRGTGCAGIPGRGHNRCKGTGHEIDKRLCRTSLTGTQLERGIRATCGGP